ncbi:MAG: hypothetical protein ABIE70_08170 [bacterium]
MASKTDKKTVSPKVEWPFGKKNYLVFAVAMVVIAVGYILLSQDDITMAPLLLVVGYCVLIPIAIMIKDRPHGSPDSSSAADDSHE